MNSKQRIQILLIIAVFDFILFVAILFVLQKESDGYVKKDLNVHHQILNQSEDLFLDESDTLSSENENLDGIENRIESNEVSKNDYNGYMDTEGVSRIKALLEGSSFYVNNTILFRFGTGDLYSGFFDSNNINVKGFSYEIVNVYDEFLLNIYDPSRATAVTYKVIIDSNNDIYLYYEAADIKMKLQRI